MDSSSLRSVFGSSASLAELSGDTQPTQRTPPGYSRFGLNERPPSHQMHTKFRRSSMPARPRKLVKKRRVAVGPAVVVLALFGWSQAVLIDYHTPFFLNPSSSAAQSYLSIVLFVATSLVAGFVISGTDKDTLPLDPRSPVHSAGSTVVESDKPLVGPPKNYATSAPSSGPNQWIQSLIRGYGIILGLVYLSEKLPGDAGQAWVFIVPSVWLMSDGTQNGFLASALIGLVCAAISYASFPGESVAPEGLVASSSPLYSLAGTATSYFATSIMAGALGRGMK